MECGTFCHGRSQEVIGGYGPLRSGKTENSGGRAGKKHETPEEKDGNVMCQVKRGECGVESVV